MANVVMRYKTFVGRIKWWSERTLRDTHEAVRAEAEAFCNLIGAENVVTVAAYTIGIQRFFIDVWYRIEEPAPARSLPPAGESVVPSQEIRLPPRGAGGITEPPSHP